MGIYEILSFVTFILIIQVSGYFFIFSNRSKTNLLFASASLLLAVYTFCMFLIQHQQALPEVLLIDRIAFSSLMLATLAFIYLFYLLQKTEPAWFKPLFYFLLPLALLLIGVYLADPGSLKFYFRENFYWYFYYENNSAWVFILIVYILLSGTLTFVLLYRRDIHAAGNKDQLQVRMILAILLFGVIFALMLDVIWPAYSAYVFLPIIHFLAIPFLTAVFYALTKTAHKYFDPEIMMDLIFRRFGFFVLLVKKNGKIIGANRQFCKFTGYRESELQELDLDDLIPGKDIINKLLFYSADGSPPLQEIIGFRTNDSLILPVKVGFFNLLDHFNRQVGVGVVGNDYGQISWREERLAECRKKLQIAETDYAQRQHVLQKREQEFSVADARLKQELYMMNVPGMKSRTGGMEKDVLISEMHHRVKNNMQIATSLIAFISSDSNLSDADSMLFIGLKERINRLSLSHERFYSTPLLTKIAFRSFLTDLANFIQRKERATIQPELKFDIADLMLPLKQAIPCGIIAEQLVENALKHAFPESVYKSEKKNLAAVVWINLFIDDGSFRLVVRDNGVGLEQGFTIEQHGKIGLKMVRYLVDTHLHGSVMLKNSFGTVAELTIPVIAKK